MPKHRQVDHPCVNGHAASRPFQDTTATRVPLPVKEKLKAAEQEPPSPLLAPAPSACGRLSTDRPRDTGSCRTGPLLKAGGRRTPMNISWVRGMELTVSALVLRWVHFAHVPEEQGFEVA